MRIDTVLKKNVLLVGEAAVGKSCLCLRITDQRFQPIHDVTVGIEFGSLVMTEAHTKKKLYFWDTAGVEQFRSISEKFYSKADLVVLIYDIGNPSCLNYLTGVYEKVQRANQHSQLPCIIIGMKLDLATTDENYRKVTSEQVKEFARNLNPSAPPPVFECSAKTGEHIDAVKTAMFEIGKFSNSLSRNDLLNEIYKTYINSGGNRLTGSFRFFQYGIFGSKFKQTEEILEMLKDRSQKNPQGASSKTLKKHENKFGQFIKN